MPIVNGVRHDTFRVTRSIAGRSPGIAMNHNPHPLKNMDAGIEALERVDRDLGVPSILFGALILAGREIQPSGVPAMIQGIILFCLIGSDVLVRYRVRWGRTAAATA